MPRIWLVLSLALFAAFLLLTGPILQDPAYFNFADQRAIAGIPHFWDVFSNVPFAVVGVLGLRKYRGQAPVVLMLGVLLTALGSAWFHLVPNSQTLVWDRLPMTLVFMSVTALIVEEWAGLRLLWPLVAFGILSIVWWIATGDLRPYGFAQFGPILLIIPAARYVPHARALWPVAVLYVLAKIAEAWDHQIYGVFFWSGHTVKHILSGAATVFLLPWLRGRPRS